MNDNPNYIAVRAGEIQNKINELIDYILNQRAEAKEKLIKILLQEKKNKFCWSFPFRVSYYPFPTREYAEKHISTKDKNLFCVFAEEEKWDLHCDMHYLSDNLLSEARRIKRICEQDPDKVIYLTTKFYDNLD